MMLERTLPPIGVIISILDPLGMEIIGSFILDLGLFLVAFGFAFRLA
jgi:hypothetical protein